MSSPIGINVDTRTGGKRREVNLSPFEKSIPKIGIIIFFGILVTLMLEVT